MQQVNLYLEELRPHKNWLTANTLGLTFSGLCLILLFSMYVNSVGLSRLETKVIELENQKVVMQDQLTKIKDMAKASNKSELDGRVAELKLFLEQRRQLRRLLHNKSMGNEAGFSSIFKGLSKNITSDIALSSIRLTSGGNYIELIGQARSPESVPDYIKLLQADRRFNDAKFGLLGLREANNGKFFDFAMGYDSLLTKVSQGAAR